MNNILQDKNIVITGIANKKSIATAIAQSYSSQGARVILVTQNERLKSRGEDVLKICNENNGKENKLLLCDCSKDEEIVALASQISDITQSVDGLVHSMAFANRDEIKGDFHSVTTRDGFALAHDVSVYSLIALVKALQPYVN